MDQPSRLLIVTFDNFAGVARLPKALKAHGFLVAALCHPTSFLAQTRYLDARFRWPVLRYRAHVLARLVAVIEVFAPTLIIPGDERSVRFLQDIVDREQAGKGLVPRAVSALLRSSLGDPASYQARSSKRLTHQAAVAAGVRVPLATAIKSREEAMGFGREHGYPVVLKKEFGVAGDGVRICRDEASLDGAFHALTAPPRRRAGVRRLARRMLGGFLAEAYCGDDGGISVHQFIGGKPVMRAVVAKSGTVLAGMTAIKERVHPAPTGPSSVIRFVRHAEIEAASTAMVARFGTTGFASFDFILETGSGHAYLLECNPRPTPMCHLGHLGESDLCAALAASLRGQTYAPGDSAMSERPIALFPQEWRHDPDSAFLKDAFHDVPWDDSGLLRAYCNAPEFR